MITPPLGIGYLLKALDGVDGINPVFIDGHRDNIEEDNLLDRIRTMRPLIVGFQVFSVDYAKFCRLIPKIRRICPETKMVAGGPHVSGLPEQTLIDNPDLDFVVKGEGEAALRLLVFGLPQESLYKHISSIPNLVYRTDNGIIMNKSELIDVNKYGAPAWEMLEPNKYPAVQHGTFHKSNKVVPILTSRGCPYPCTFCAGHLLTGKKIRRRNVKDIVDEIEFLQSSYGFEEFIIEDENFTFYKDHVLDLSNEIKKRNIQCYFSFPNGIRLDRLDDEIVYHLKQMGTYMVTLGIESGSKKTLKAMKKDWDLQMIKDKIRLLRKNGIIVLGSFILGFSNETMEDIKKTINFAIKSGIDTAYFGNYIPLPGSEDFNRMIRENELKLGEIDWNTYTSYFGRLPYHPRNVSERDLLKAIRWGTIRFYCRPKIVFGLLNRMSHIVFLQSLVSRILNLFR
jgi:radical SAM superfamily enzyme YgiQ (UPF0313 family)